MSLLTRQPRSRSVWSRLRVHGALTLLVVVALLVTDRGTLDARQERWVQRCATSGGVVRQVDPPPPNPLLTRSDDPTYLCLGPDGHVLNRWR